VSVLVQRSRHTPGIASAKDVALRAGDRVTYRLLNGCEVKGTIASEKRQHTNGALGWETMFDDTRELGFADENRIVDWEGKL
jgi:hypothetical protein